MTYLTETIVYNSIRKDPAGNVELSASGKMLTVAFLSYLIHRDIIKERDKAAIENVKIITVLIEECGNFTPHISARELIKRNVLLSDRLNNAPDTRKRNRILKSVFTDTWKYIKKDTDLLTVYEALKIPEIIPTIQDLDIVYNFSNKGKKHPARKS